MQLSSEPAPSSASVRASKFRMKFEGLGGWTPFVFFLGDIFRGLKIPQGLRVRWLGEPDNGGDPNWKVYR